jgi:hypothetical protein
MSKSKTNARNLKRGIKKSGHLKGFTTASSPSLDSYLAYSMKQALMQF